MASRSDCIMAHVRAASKNTGISQQNCHPFKAGRLLFCHNGRIDKFIRIRRALMSKLSDEAYTSVRGTTDSECIFALILTYLSQDGKSAVSPFEQTSPFGHQRLVVAIKKALRTIEILVQEANISDEGGYYSTYNFSLVDGDTMVITRFCDKSPEVPPPSLYFAYGTAQRLLDELTHEDPVLFVSSQSTHGSVSADDLSTKDSDSEPEMEMYDEKPVLLDQHESRPGRLFSDVDPAAACFIVASNPLTRTHTWTPLPKNSIMWYERGSIPELRLLRGRSRTMSLVHQ